MLAILLLDENISPNIVEELWNNDVDAVHIRDRNLLEAADHEIWRFASQESRAVVTINARDFLKLAQRSDRHAGLVVIPSGGTREAQLSFIMTAVAWVGSSNSDAGFTSRYIEVGENGEIVLTRITCRDDSGTQQA